MRKTIVCLFAFAALGLNACASGDKPAADKTAPAKVADTTKPAPFKIADSTRADTAKAAEKKVEYVTTKSGLKYFDEKVGTGAEAVAGKHVAVDYTVWLYVDGQKKGSPLDSSIPRGKPYPLVLGNREVIAGWDEGLVGMKVGGKRSVDRPAAVGVR